MSWKATNYAKDVLVCPNGQKITRTEKLLLMVMADQHTTHQGLVFVSQRNLATESMLSIRHLRRCLESLERKLVIKTETGLGRGNLSGYSLPGMTPKKEDMESPLKMEKGTSVIIKEDAPLPTHSKEVEQESGTGKKDDDLDPTQDLLPWMEKQWDALQRTQPKALRRKFNPGPHAEQFERQQAAVGLEPYRRAFLEYLYGPDNRGMVNFAKLIAEQVPRGTRNGSNGHKASPVKSVTDMWYDLHPEFQRKNS